MIFKLEFFRKLIFKINMREYQCMNYLNMWRHIILSSFQNKGRMVCNLYRSNCFNNFISFRLIFTNFEIMYKVIILAIVCLAFVNGNLKDDLKDKITEALHEGEKVKVC